MSNILYFILFLEWYITFINAIHTTSNLIYKRYIIQFHEYLGSLYHTREMSETRLKATRKNDGIKTFLNIGIYFLTTYLDAY